MVELKTRDPEYLTSNPGGSNTFVLFFFLLKNTQEFCAVKSNDFVAIFVAFNCVYIVQRLRFSNSRRELYLIPELRKQSFLCL